MKEQDKWKRGLPYVGNKGQKAQQIIDAMPSGGRFIDVFGGGGSISLTAADSGKWDQIIYNDRRETVVKLLEALLKDDPHIDLSKYAYMTREDFFNWRDNMPDSIERTARLLCWSFGNNMNAYLYGENAAKSKLLAARGVYFGDTGTVFDLAHKDAFNSYLQMNQYYHKWGKAQNRILFPNILQKKLIFSFSFCVK